MPSSQFDASRESRGTFDLLLIALCTIAVVRLWLLPAANSFWLDETLIAWTIREGPGAIVPRAFISLQSIAFCLVEWPFSQVGGSEFALRVPSLLAGFGAAFFCYRIGVESADRELGLLLAALSIVWPSVVVEIPNARPYALALCFHTAALYWLLSWRRTARLRHGLLWIACAAAATHMHHLFVSAIPVETLFVLWGALARTTPVPVSHVLFCSVIGVTLLLPALPQAMVFVSQRALLSYSGPPAWSAFASALVPLRLMPAPAIVALIESIGGRRSGWTADRPGRDAFVLGMLLLSIAVAFFAVSRLTTARFFEARYLLPTVPALIIVWGWLLHGLAAPLRRLMLLAVVVYSTVFTGGVSLVPDYRGENWRDAVHVLPDSGALIVYPGLVETRKLDWLQDPERWDYFTAPISAYRDGVSPASTWLLPFERGGDEQAYAAGLVEALGDGPLVTLIVRATHYGPLWTRWFTERLAGSGFLLESHRRYGGVEVLVFRRRPPGA